MAKVDFLSLSRPEDITETRVFTDPRFADVPISITLTVCADYGTQTLAGEIGTRYYQQFVTGGKSGRPAPFPPLGNPPRAVRITKTLCLVIGGLMALQSGETNYTFVEWVGCSVMTPTAFGSIMDWANKLLAKVSGEDDPND